jgi:hypothetical protein
MKKMNIRLLAVIAAGIGLMILWAAAQNRAGADALSAVLRLPLFLLSVLLMIGLIKPERILIWSKKPTRLKVFGWWILIMSVYIISSTGIVGTVVNGANVADYATGKWGNKLMRCDDDSSARPPTGAKFIFYNLQKRKFESSWKWRREKRYAKKPEEISVIVTYSIGTKKVGDIVEYNKKTHEERKVFDAEEDYIEFKLIDAASWKCFDSFTSRSTEHARVEKHKIKLYQPTDDSLRGINDILAKNDLWQDSTVMKAPALQNPETEQGNEIINN